MSIHPKSPTLLLLFKIQTARKKNITLPHQFPDKRWILEDFWPTFPSRILSIYFLVEFSSKATSPPGLKKKGTYFRTVQETHSIDNSRLPQKVVDIIMLNLVVHEPPMFQFYGRWIWCWHSQTRLWALSRKTPADTENTGLFLRLWVFGLRWTRMID